MSHQLRRLTTTTRRRSKSNDQLESSISSSLDHHHLLTTTSTNNILHNNNNNNNNSTITLYAEQEQEQEEENRLRFITKRRRRGVVVDLRCRLSNLWSRNPRQHNKAMATVSELLRIPQHDGKKKLGNQHKREELQREVSMLQNMLSHEEKVREILQQAYNRKVGSDVTLPNHVPPKMKELLSELATVEDEIVQLESQIQQLQTDVKSEQEAIKDSKSRQIQSVRSSSSLRNQLQAGTSTTTTTNSSNDQRIGYDTKALHFINKAINGGYSLSDFTINEKNMVGSPLLSTPGNSSPYVHYHKDNTSGYQERVIKRSGMLKPASPLRDFRHPTPKPKERSTEFRMEVPRKSISGPAQVEETGTKWQPNKLSENIMKSLILIYVRLIRTSRQMELEKSGPISRSLYSSVSFRTEPGVVNLSTSFQKESKQQDPYGIFDIEGAVPRDIGPYKNLVVFTSSSLEPKYVSHSSSIPLFQKLRGLFNSLQKVDLRSLTEQQKLAFWVNIYNACIMHGFLQFGVPSTPEKLLSLLNKATLNVGGKIVNAQAIERCILRKPTSYIAKEGDKDSKEAIIHELYGLDSMNPNTIFALCCGTRSSPAVRIYTAEGVVSELEKSKLEYLQASISVTTSKKIGLPELLIQNMHDFNAKDMESLVEWVCLQLPTSGSLRKSIVECFRGLNNNGRMMSNCINAEKLSYDFDFQYLLQV